MIVLEEAVFFQSQKPTMQFYFQLYWICSFKIVFAFVFFSIFQDPFLHLIKAFILECKLSIYRMTEITGMQIMAFLVFYLILLKKCVFVLVISFASLYITFWTVSFLFLVKCCLVGHATFLMVALLVNIHHFVCD